MRSIATAERLGIGVGGRRPTPLSLLPTAMFLAVDQWLGLVPAMIVASGTTIALLVVRRRNGKRLGMLLPLSLGYVVVKAVAGVATGSQVVYFGAGLALSASITVAVGLTAFTHTPLASHLIPMVTPYRHLSADHPIYRAVSAQVTAVWALAELGITAWEAWHLTVASASEFVIVRTVVAWPVMAVLIFFLIAYVRFRLDRYEYVLARSALTASAPSAA